MYDAGTALAGIAANVGAGLAEVLPNHLYQKSSRLHFGIDRLAVQHK